MGYIARMKYNMERKRAEYHRIKALGRITYVGKLDTMPSYKYKSGKKYKEMRIHSIFGHSQNVVIEMNRRARKT